MVKLLTTTEAARVLGISRQRVLFYCKRKHDPLLAQKAGRNFLIASDVVAAFKRIKREAGRPKSKGNGKRS